MCGIIAILLADRSKHVNQLLFDGLTVLQHRGQDAAGMVTAEGTELHLRKDKGLVRDVFSQEHMTELRGHFGLGHCRYPTAGSSSCAEAQPLYTNAPYGISVAHNGNLTNYEELSARLRSQFRHINTKSDSELLLNIFAEELQRRQRPNLKHSQIFEATSEVMSVCRGGYAVVMLINGVGLLAFRDPYGIRPAVFGTRASGPDGAQDLCVASESVALDTLGFKLVGDVAAGEALFFDARSNTLHRRMCAEAASLSPCIFEYVYFARPDSVMNGIGVYEPRLRMGEHLARRILALHPSHDIDVVIPIPDTSRTCALQCAAVLNRPFREGFIKNRYIARTFIMPGQAQRRKTVRLKLNTIGGEFRGRSVLLVDDSIVRGTTSTEIVQMARDAGAKRVYFCSAAPAVRHPNVYGVDIPTRSELVAHGREDAEVAGVIGADWVVYQSIDDLEQAVWDAAAGVSADGDLLYNVQVNGVLQPGEAEERRAAARVALAAAKERIPRFDSSCFSGEYITGDIDEQYLHNLAGGRNDAVRFGGNEFPLDGSDASGSPKYPVPQRKSLRDATRSTSRGSSAPASPEVRPFDSVNTPPPSMGTVVESLHNPSSPMGGKSNNAQLGL